jgi:hypothetical protein
MSLKGSCDCSKWVPRAIYRRGLSGVPSRRTSPVKNPPLSVATFGSTRRLAATTSLVLSLASFQWRSWAGEPSELINEQIELLR